MHEANQSMRWNCSLVQTVENHVKQLKHEEINNDSDPTAIIQSQQVFYDHRIKVCVALKTLKTDFKLI